MNEEIKYAGFWSRFLATIIDSIWLYGTIYAILWWLMGSSIFEPEAQYTTTQLIFEWIIPIVVVTVFWIKMSATPGKMLLNMTIVDVETYDKVPAKRLFIQYMAYFVSTIPIFLGFFWIAWDKKKQGWHDKIARTVIIKKTKAR